mgnify:CR=1 FL=1
MYLDLKGILKSSFHILEEKQILIVQENDVGAPMHSSPDTPSIMKHYLKTIQVLQRKLNRREQELKTRNESLQEITNELARDQKIFSEKVP